MKPVSNRLLDDTFDSDSFTYTMTQGMISQGKEYLSKSEFNRIEIEMTLDEVKEIIGKSGELTAESNKSTIYQWNGKDENGSVMIHFSNNKIITKSQSGLE